MPHQKPDIRKQSYPGSSALQITGKTEGVHIRTQERSGRAVSERSDSPPYQLPSHGVLPVASTPYALDQLFTEGNP